MQVGSLSRLKLKTQDRLYRARHAIGRFGVGLFISEQIFRRFGPAAWHERCLDRIHQIKKAQWR